VETFSLNARQQESEPPFNPDESRSHSRANASLIFSPKGTCIEAVVNEMRGSRKRASLYSPLLVSVDAHASLIAVITHLDQLQGRLDQLVCQVAAQKRELRRTHEPEKRIRLENDIAQCSTELVRLRQEIRADRSEAVQTRT
jgi:hypothetical protein